MEIVISKYKKPETSLMPELIIKIQFRLARKGPHITQNIKLHREKTII